MATEKCSICGELGTPWTSTPELGTGLHMCHNCSLDRGEFVTGFNKYIHYIQHMASDVNGKSLYKNLKPRTIKKFTYLLIRKWYNDRMNKI